MAADGTVNIAVLGDERVGKTALITAAATESFPDHPPPVLPPTKLPADATPEGVPILITDTSSRPEDRQALEQACLSADVIVLVFDTGRPDTLTRVSTYWMPELQRLGITVPTVLVGCKSDLKPMEQHLQQVVVPVMNRWKEIETCLECSAKQLIFVGEVFYYALKAVVHPTAPLFDPQANAGQGALKPLCVKALKRIFIMCDKDKDGALSDDELNAFQVRCFSMPLQPDELAGVKQVVSEKMPQGVNERGLTLAGFLFLHALFIERGRLETTWTVLRKFGYDNSLRLAADVLGAVSFQRGPDQVVELTEAARAFLRRQFTEFDRDTDGALSPAEQDDMFSSAPEQPWPDAFRQQVLVQRSAGGGLTLHGFLAAWAYVAATDPPRALAGLLYLGYEGDPSALFAVSRTRHQERKADAPRRAVCQCCLFGASREAKAALMDALVRRGDSDAGSSSEDQPMPSTSYDTAVGTVERPDGSATTVVLRAVDEGRLATLLAAPQRRDELAGCDVAAFTFSPTAGSFRAAAGAVLQVATAAGDVLPCVLVEAPGARPAGQEVQKEVQEACASLGLRLPSALDAALPDLLAAADHPDDAIPLTPSLQAARAYRRMLRRGLLVVGIGGATAIAAYAIYKSAQRHRAAQREGLPTPALPELKGGSLKADSLKIDAPPPPS